MGVSVVETYGKEVEPRELEATLRIEYRSKLLNPKWAEAMSNQAREGDGGALGWVPDLRAYAIRGTGLDRLRRAPTFSGTNHLEMVCVGVFLQNSRGGGPSIRRPE